MDKNSDMYNYYGFAPPYSNMSGMFDSSCDPASNIPGSMDSNVIFNPLIQYEQAYMYYRYLSQQMEYKIKCKEYERMNSRSENSKDNNRKLE